MVSDEPPKVLGWCQVLSSVDEQSYPLMVLVTEPNGFKLGALPELSDFAILSWSDILIWESYLDEGSWENNLFILTPADTGKLPDDVIGLVVREPSDAYQWVALLKANVPRLSPDT